MNFKRFLTLLLALTLVFALVSCKKCKDHVDADDDYKCDKCDADYDDGDEAPEITKEKVTFTVKLDNGNALSGVKFSLVRGETVYNLVSGADGSVTVTADPGAYSIEYIYETLPQYCTPDTFGVKIEQGKTAVTLTITDNRPDGSAAKPFFISDNETEITLAPGEELYYNYRGASQKHVNIYTTGIDIVYNGETYTASEGSVTALLKPEIGMVTTFSIKNVSAESISTTMHLIAPIGSNENPHKLTESTAVAMTSSEQIIYYQWTADKSGVLVVTDSTKESNISLTKVLANDISVTTQTEGTNVGYLPVTAGERVLIGVSMLNSNGLTAVTFNVKTYEGTESDPVPVLKNRLDISLAAGSSVVFKLNSATAKTLTVSDESPISVTHGGQTYTNEEGDISLSLSGVTFTVTNDADHINGIEIKITMMQN